MAFQPMRMANSTAFTSMLDPNLNAELTANMAAQGLGALAGRRANKIKLDAQIEMAKAGQKGGFDLGSGLSMLAGGLNMAKGFGLFGGGGGGGGLGSAFTSKNVQMPDYMGGAGNFSSFFS